MELFARMLDNPVGLMTVFTILFMIGMAFWMIGFFKMKIEEEARQEAASSDQKDKKTSP